MILTVTVILITEYNSINNVNDEGDDYYSDADDNRNIKTIMILEIRIK